MAATEDDTYEIPLTGQKYFGAGIVRKRVAFVPSSSTPDSSIQENAEHTKLRGTSVKDAYLSIVFNGEGQKPSLDTSISQAESQAQTPNDLVGPIRLRNENPVRENDVEGVKDSERLNIATQPGTCAVCNLPIMKNTQHNLDSPKNHNSSGATSYEPDLTNQLCARHLHPPSSIDRRRKGLAILQRYGWDPDAGRGLGASESGRLHPIKANVKNDTTGIGAKREANSLKPKVQKLDAGKIVKREKEERKKTERWREIFYGRDDLEKYLGPTEPP